MPRDNPRQKLGPGWYTQGINTPEYVAKAKRNVDRLLRYGTKINIQRASRYTVDRIANMPAHPQYMEAKAEQSRLLRYGTQLKQQGKEWRRKNEA